jgi:hypothetical protein
MGLAVLLPVIMGLGIQLARRAWRKAMRRI